MIINNRKDPLTKTRSFTIWLQTVSLGFYDGQGI